MTQINDILIKSTRSQYDKRSERQSADMAKDMINDLIPDDEKDHIPYPFADMIPQELPQELPEELPQESRQELLQESPQQSSVQESTPPVTDAEEEVTMRTSGTGPTILLHEGHIQTILALAVQPAVQRIELANRSLAKGLQRFMDHVVDLGKGVAERKELTSEGNSEVTDQHFIGRLIAEEVTPNTLQEYALYLTKWSRRLPLKRKLNDVAIGTFVSMGEEHYRLNGELTDKRRRFVKKQIELDIDTEAPLPTDIRKKFSRYARLIHIEKSFGPLIWYQGSISSVLEEMSGGERTMRRLIDILEAMNICSQWKAASEELIRTTEPTPFEIALQRMQTNFDSMFPIGAEERQRWSGPVASRTRG